MAKSTKKLYTGAQWESEGYLKGLRRGPPLKGKDAEYDTYIDPAVYKYFGVSGHEELIKKFKTTKSKSPKTSCKSKSDARPKTKSQTKSQSAAQATYSSHAK